MLYHEAVDWIFHKELRRPDTNEIIKFLIKEYLNDVKEEVTRVNTDWNTRTRDYIRNQTGLSLSSNHLYGEKTPLNQSEKRSKKVFQIKVNISDIIPPGIYSLINQHQSIWPLLVNKKNIEQTAKGLNLIEKLVFNLTHSENSTFKNRNSYLNIKEDIRFLIKKANEFDLTRELQNIPGNIFGSYNPINKTVNIYWFTIGFYARLKNLTIENVCLVVLSHELAHAYSQLGFDIDDMQWDIDDFMMAELPIVEGVAEYYSKKFCEYYNTKHKGLLATYLKILHDSPKDYHLYKNWFEGVDEYEMGEVVRFAMIIARTKGVRKYSKFKNLIEEGKENFIYPIA